MADQAAELRSALSDVDVAPPGRGGTAERHRVLFELARRHPVWVGRLAEAHLDALAILTEAGRDPAPGALYGVWAAAGDLRAAPDAAAGDGWGTATGTKPFCSGLGIVDRALVTARVDGVDGTVLLDLDVTAGPTAVHDLDGWGTPALAASATGALELRAHPVDGVVGEAGWYLSRPGFWHGACGPAAVWAGATTALVDHAEDVVGDDPHRRAHLGAMRAAVWALEAVLDGAGRQIDISPDDVLAARHRAQAVRHTVERTCADVLDRFGRALGPRPYVGDAAVAQRAADVHLYLRQHHAERDLEDLGRLPRPVVARDP